MMRIRLPCRWMVFAAMLTGWCAAPAARVQIAIDPTAWGLAVGDTFRLVLVTYGTTNATSTSIADYDSFVNSQNLNLITYHGSALNWQAIGLTPDSNPVTDTSRYSSQANGALVFNLSGQLVSNTNAGSQFWRTSGSNQHAAAINFTIDASGDLALSGHNYAWTGFDYNGAVVTERDYDSGGEQIGTVSTTLGTSVAYHSAVYNDDGEPIGSTATTMYAAYGRIPALFNGWAYLGNDSPLTTQYPMYAMSELITVTAVPEPATYAVAMGLTILGAVGAKRWAKRKATGAKV